MIELKLKQLKYNLVFIVTYQNNNNIYSLLDSLKQNCYVKLLVILVNQTGELTSTKMDNFTDFVQIETSQLPLSVARNVAITHLLEKNVNFNHIMFIDDDSSFNNSFFENYISSVKINFNYIIDVFCLGTDKLYIKNIFINKKEVMLKDYRNVFSVNMIISKECFDFLKYFDSNLGAGTKYGSGEDLDYFIRAKSFDFYFQYNKDLYNFHPSPNDKYQNVSFENLIKRFIKYGDGVIYVLCKHGLYFYAFLTCIRGLLGSVLYLFKLNIKLSISYFISFISRLILMIRMYLNHLYNGF